MNRRFALLSVAAAVGIALTYFDPPGAAGPVAKRPLVLHVGDTVRLQGTSVGCAVTRRNGSTVIECLDAARRAGTYATLIGDREVLVARFTTPAVARTVFRTHQHDARFTICK
jgi:hypothetical protein